MMDEVVSTQTFKLKGRLYTLTVLHICNPDLSLFTEQLVDAKQRAPRLFEHTPVILDCSALMDVAFDLVLFCQRMREHGVYPVAIQGGSLALQAKAQAFGLPLLHGSSQHDKPLLEEKTEPAVSQERVNKTKLYTAPIRSGQQIINEDGDLIVLSTVSHGAELLAAGHIHVYGALRGRALAGINGDQEARIFCHDLDAELLAIAGIYCLSDDMQKMAGFCQIYLQDDRIQIESL
ncbi:MAG: septum site-determining protein MinC [Gammaproteobacteria bacterium]|nr:septum site-determining protein MinC [Gammaproteobacteria bacterium]